MASKTDGQASGFGTSGASGAGSAARPVVVTAKARWSAVPRNTLASERADDSEVVTARWDKVNAMFGAASDQSKDEVFAHVNAYFAKNGSSPEGGYTKAIICASASVPASDIVKITGTADGALRKFLRGRLQHCVNALKYSGLCENDPEMAAEAVALGLSSDQAWLLADWLVPKNPYLTIDESATAERIRTHKISRSHISRGGAPVGVSGQRAVEEPVTPAPVAVDGGGYVGKTMY
jgi:hypothetical protein